MSAESNITMTTDEQLKRQHFAEAVSSLRRYAGLSRRELARRAGLPLSRVAKLEKALDGPSEDDRARLERAIGCPLYFGKHQQVVVTVGEWKAEVDAGIAPLIRELWVADIETIMSCQQNTLGSIWIAFADAYDAARFLNIVARYQDGSDDLYWRINMEGTGKGPLPDWEYALFVEDLALNEDVIDDEVERSYDPPADFDFEVSVRFPPQDLPVVLRRLKEHNAALARRKMNSAVQPETPSASPHLHDKGKSAVEPGAEHADPATVQDREALGRKLLAAFRMCR